MKGIKAYSGLFLTLSLLFCVLIFGPGDSLFKHPLEGRVVNADYLLRGSPNDIEILFFGYVGCSVVCPQSLHQMSVLVDELNDENPDVKVGALFADVASLGNMTSADAYAGAYSEHLRGINLRSSDIKRIRSDFVVRSRKTGRGNTDISHTDHFFVVEKADRLWRIKSIWPNGTKISLIKKSLAAG